MTLRRVLGAIGIVAAVLALPLASAFSSPLPLSSSTRTATAAEATVEVSGVPAGWNSGWQNQDVTLTITARSITGVVSAAWSMWDASAANTMPPLQQTGTATTKVVVAQEGKSAVLGAAVRPDGSVAASSSVYVRIDKTKPRLGYRFGVPFTSSWTSATTVPVTLVATESLSGLRNGIQYRFQRNGVSSSIQTTLPGSTVTMLGEGRYALEASATDLAGNASASTWTTFGVDATPPKTSLDATSYVGRADISLRAYDALSGVRNTFYQLDEAAVQSGNSLTISLSSDASQTAYHRLRFWSVDLAGNVETAAPEAREVTITVVPDDTAPSTTLKDVEGRSLDSWFPGRAILALVATDPAPASGVLFSYFRIGDGAVATYTAPITVSGEDSATVEYWSVDRCGVVEATKTATIRFDAGKPYSHPEVRTAFTSVATVWISAFDAKSGVASIDAWIDEGEPQRLATGTPGVLEVSAAAACSTAGAHKLNYVTTDFAGNREETRTVVVYVRRNTSFSMNTKSASLSNTALPARATVSGSLRDGTVPVKNRTVYIEYSSSPTFSKYSSASTVTDSKGAFAFTTTLSTKTYYRMHYKGESDYAPSVSSTIRLLPRAYLSAPTAKTTQRADRSFTVAGTIKPGHTSSATLRIKKYLLVAGKPVYKGYTKAAVTSKGTYATFKASLRLTRGTWRLYAYMPEDSAHAVTTSTGYLTVRVSP